ncbi:HIT domain-containing protein [Candidatus Woesearchaeota archaeon]|nr:HIT domain-containing protein [Candidatus Woesearchaeota archaeon]
MTEGQQGQVTEEDLKNMTPEQIAEMQKQNCIFCHIIAGKVASRKVYEDDKAVGILDINPANPGHVVIIPKEHYAIMPQIPEDILAHLFMVTKGISQACLKAFKAQGTNIFVANGAVAGQRAQHFMIHIIPRKENDGITSFKLPEKQIDEQQIEEIRKILRQKLNEMMGLKEEVIDFDKKREDAQQEEGEGKESEEPAASGKSPEDEGPEEPAEAEGDEAPDDIRKELSGEGPEEEPETEEQAEEGSEDKESKKDEEIDIDIDKIADLFK